VRRLTLIIRIKIRFFNWQHHPADGNKCPPIWGTAMPDISCHLMRHLIIIISTFFPTLSFGQVQNIIGTYSSIIPKVEVKFNSDSTFEYITTEQHPTFYRWEPFSEKGHWTVSGDTIILNPQLSKRLFVESDFEEGEIEDVIRHQCSQIY